MGKPNQTRAELTLGDFMRLKGSRWKAKFKECEGDLEAVYYAIREATLDIPQIINIKAIWVFDEIDITATTDWTGVLYEKFMKYEDRIPEIVVMGVSNPVELTAMLPQETVELPNTMLQESNTRLRTARKAVTSYNNDINSYRERVQRKLDLLYNTEAIVSNLIEDIELLKTAPAPTLDVEAIFKEIVGWCGDNGAFMYGMRHYRQADLSSGVAEVTIERYSCIVVVPPMLITNVNNPSATKCTSQPIHVFMKLHITGSESRPRLEMDVCNDSLYCKPSGSYSSVQHSHIGSYICWGDTLDAVVAKAGSEMNPTIMLDSLLKLIANHNSGSPFCTWEELVDDFSYESLLAQSPQAMASIMSTFLHGIALRARQSGHNYLENFKSSTTTVFPMKVTLENFLGRELHDRVIGFDRDIAIGNTDMYNMALLTEGDFNEDNQLAVLQTNSRLKLERYFKRADGTVYVSEGSLPFGYKELTFDEYTLLRGWVANTGYIPAESLDILFDILVTMWGTRHITNFELERFKIEGRRLNYPRFIMETGKVIERDKLFIGENNEEEEEQSTN